MLVNNNINSTTVIEQVRKHSETKNFNSECPEISKTNNDNNNENNHNECTKESSTIREYSPNIPKRKLSLVDTFHKHQRHLRKSFKAAIESSGPITRYRQTRFSSRRIRKRVIFKHGDCNIVQGNVAKRRKRYMQDIFTTLVDAQWRWTLLVFILSFLVSWAIFGVIWYTIAYTHGDIKYLQSTIKENNDSNNDRINETFTVCIKEIHGFTSAFLYSVETQHTIGYGNRYITEECPGAIFVMCLQCTTGVIIQSFMVGIVFAKLSRPKKRAQTLLFSRNAVICHRDGVPCLMFRVGDMRKSHILEAHVRAQVIRKKVTKEGEELPFYQQELKVGSDGSEDRLLFIWPTIILHKINRQSPLYALSAQDIFKERFEIIVMLEGIVESTGMTTQARSSYLPSEILWGHRFEPVLNFKKETGEYEVDYTKFNHTYEIETPSCSSKQLDEIKTDLNLTNGLEGVNSTALLTQVSSVTSLEPISDDSTESIGRLQIRSKSLSNMRLRKNYIDNINDMRCHFENNNNPHSSINSVISKPEISIGNGSIVMLTQPSNDDQCNFSHKFSETKDLVIIQDQYSTDSIC